MNENSPKKSYGFYSLRLFENDLHLALNVAALDGFSLYVRCITSKILSHQWFETLKEATSCSIEHFFSNDSKYSQLRK